MSGYIHNLLVRSRESAEVLRPRVASLFEPAAPRTQLPEMTEEVDVRVLASTPAVQEADFDERRGEDRVEQQQRSDEGPATQVKRERPAQVNQPAQTAVQPPLAHRAAPLKQRGQETRLPFAPAEGNATPKPPAPQPEASSTGAERAATAPAVPPAVRERVMAQAVSKVESKRPGEDDYPALKSERAPVPPSRPPLLAPGSRPRLAAPFPVRVEKRTDPVVEVTIGRIEVRAVSEPAKPSRTRQQPAAMSLDEYLKTRARGAGR